MSEFAFKELTVWQDSIELADSVLTITEEVANSKRHYRLIEQLESCAVSVSQNIAEGKGRNSRKEFIQFLFFARGSLNETVSLLTVFERRKLISKEQLTELESHSLNITIKLNALIKSIRNAK